MGSDGTHLDFSSEKKVRVFSPLAEPVLQYLENRKNFNKEL